MKHPVIQQLRMERRARDMSQMMLGEITGYNRCLLSQYETGVCSPTLNTLQDWANALGYELVLKKRGEG